MLPDWFRHFPVLFIEMGMALVHVNLCILSVIEPAHHCYQTDDDELFHGGFF